MAKNDTSDFEALARRYWAAWGETMRGGTAPDPMQAGMQAWHKAIDDWTRLAHGGRADIDDAVGRFNTQAHDWYGRMQQVAAQCAGQQANASDIAAAWKQALGAAGDNPFPEMLRGLRGQGLQGLDQWIEDASPMLQAWQREAATTLGMPAFGVAREHQQRWQRLAQAQLDYQQCNNAYNSLMARAGQNAFELFEAKLAERAAADELKLKSSRALFDLWIDAAEEAYADIALAPEFREVYGALVNAQMRLRAGVQREVEQVGATLGMPTRTEVDAAHRKITELERELRRLRDAADKARRAGDTRAGRPSPAKKKARPSTPPRTAAKKTAAKVAKKAPRKAVKSPAKRTSAGKPATGKR